MIFARAYLLRKSPRPFVVKPLFMVIIGYYNDNKKPDTRLMHPAILYRHLLLLRVASQHCPVSLIGYCNFTIYFDSHATWRILRMNLLLSVPAFFAAILIDSDSILSILIECTSLVLEEDLTASHSCIFI
jgi:hypothetical protein